MNHPSKRMLSGALLVGLALLVAGCDSGDPEPGPAERAPAVTLELDGESLWDFRFVDGLIVPCHLGVEHEVCATTPQDGSRTTVRLGQSTGEPPRGGHRGGGPNADQSDNPFSFAEGFTEGHGEDGPSFSTDPGVTPAYSAEVRVGATTALTFGGSASFYAEPPGVSASQSVSAAGGACNPIQELCAFAAELSAFSSGGVTSYGECVRQGNRAVAQSAEFARLIRSAFYCRVVAFFRCMLPSISQVQAAVGDPDAAAGAALGVFFQCAHHLGGLPFGPGGDGDPGGTNQPESR